LKKGIFYAIIIKYMANSPIRINKYLADQKIASRREADALIESGKILINGKPAALGAKVSEGDKVEVLGLNKKNQYLAYYKGRGVITHSPSAEETDIAMRLKRDYGLTGLSPLGRLDKDSEGLIILSNDGRLTGPLLDPEAGHEKEYEVTVDKAVTGMFVKLMSLGVDIEGYKTKLAKVVAHPRNDKRFNLIITEGKKHQIRRMCAALGYQVETLKRVRIMNIELGTLKPNQFRKIAGSELKELMTTLGLQK
jgi:23S rRNA pseudouridine2604 synthase